MHAVCDNSVRIWSSFDIKTRGICFVLATMAALNAMLADAARLAVVGGYRATHTSMDGGKYMLWKHQSAAFFKAYSEAIDCGKALALVERRDCDSMPILVDLDFRQMMAGRQFTHKHVVAFVSALYAGLRSVA